MSRRCIEDGAELRGRQRRYCSDRCRKAVERRPSRMGRWEVQQFDGSPGELISVIDGLESFLDSVVEDVRGDLAHLRDALRRSL